MALISNVTAGATIDPTWGNAVRDATVQVTTSGARPSPAAEGMVIYETDTDLFLVYNGTAWVQIGNGGTTNTLGAWSSWTATLWQNANVTQTVDRAVFARIGRIVHGVCHITAGGAGTANTGGIQVRYSGLPAPAYTTNNLTVGVGRFQITSGNFIVLQVDMTSTAFGFKLSGHDYTFGSSSNAAAPGNRSIVSGDKISFQFTYEAA